MKISPETQICFKSDKISGIFTWSPKCVHIAESSILQLYNSENGPQYCISMATTLYTLLADQQQEKVKALLCFHSNNGQELAPRYYVMRKLPTLFNIFIHIVKLIHILLFWHTTFVT